MITLEPLRITLTFQDLPWEFWVNCEVPQAPQYSTTALNGGTVVTGEVAVSATPLVIVLPLENPILRLTPPYIGEVPFVTLDGIIEPPAAVPCYHHNNSYTGIDLAWDKAEWMRERGWLLYGEVSGQPAVKLVRPPKEVRFRT